MRLNWTDALSFCSNNYSVLIPIDNNIYPKNLFIYMNNDYIDSTGLFWVIFNFFFHIQIQKTLFVLKKI